MQTSEKALKRLDKLMKIEARARDIKTTFNLSESVLDHLKRILDNLLRGGCDIWPSVRISDGKFDSLTLTWNFGDVEREFVVKEPTFYETEASDAVVHAILLEMASEEWLSPEGETAGLEECLGDCVEPEGGSFMPLDYVEELRLCLNSFMQPSVLTSLNDLLAVLNKEPRPSEAYSTMARSSEHGFQCRYALAYLERFKTERLDKTLELLEVCLQKVKELKSETSKPTD